MFFVRRLLCISLIASLSADLYAQRQLIYDPERGIVFEDEPKRITTEKQSPSSEQKAVPKQKRDSNDLHLNRKKDPPELYFRSGLEYFKNRDYKNALKNFSYADSVARKPHYLLWKGKTLRQLGDSRQMLSIMEQIVEKYSESDVADDALLETALYYQSNDDYEKAAQIYTRLIEQFPFGTSFSNGEELREIAREQRRVMRAEITTLLASLGYTDNDFTVSCKKFQKANNLEITGTPNRETVSTIRKLHKDLLNKEEKRAKNKAMALRFSKWNTAIALFTLVNITLLFSLLIKIKAGKRRLEDLSAMLKDLDTRKL